MNKEFEKYEVSEALSDFYLPFASYVLQTRAIPDARDGLKTGARFILYAQYLDKLTYDKKKRKAVATVGAAMRFSPHGDSSIYGNAVRMSQNFALRYPVIETQGNNGSMLSGDDFSASRYLEMRSGAIANEMTALLNKNTIEKWKLNYTQEELYPTVLPTKFPFSLVNGNTGIGVGCSSSIPQFNLNDVCGAIMKMIDNPNVDFEDIYCPIDFATGGIIINESQVKESLKNGKGKAAAIRAKVIYDDKHHELVVTEMPYQSFTSNAVVSIQKAIDEGRLLGVDTVFDGTDLSGVKICVKLTKSASPERVVKQLYKETSLQSYYSINMMMLKDGKIPTLFNWKSAMEAYLNHLKDVVRKAFEFDLQKIKNRIHILEGYSKALEDIDNVVKTIKDSKSTLEAKAALSTKYGFSEEQSKAILDLKLQRLVNMEKIKIEKELDDKRAEALVIENILNVEENFKSEIKKEILAIQKKYGDKRRTVNMDLIKGDNEENEPVEKKTLIVHMTNFGNLYTSETTTLIAQKRGGKGNKIKLSNGEYITETISDTNYGTAMVFSSYGKIYTFNLDELPIDQKINLAMMFELQADEKITNLISYQKADDYKYIIFTTKQGMVKKSELSEYKVKKSKGVIGLKLKDGDELINISFCNDEPLGIATEEGQFLIIDTTQINPIGRAAMGVKGIKLNTGDGVIDAKLLPKTTKEIVSVTKKGLIKRTDFSDFSIGTRHTKGSSIQKIKEDDVFIGFNYLDGTEKELMIVSAAAIIKIFVGDIPKVSKGAQGVQSMKTEKDIIEIVRGVD